MTAAVFREVYEVELRAAVEKYPDEYVVVGSLSDGVDRMMRAIHENRFNHAGRALRATCKKLGIKHTQKAIRAFVAGEAPPAASTPAPVPLIQLTNVSPGPRVHTTLVVAQDASCPELDAIMRDCGIDPAGFWERIGEPGKGERWLKEQGLTMLPGKRRS